MTSGQRKRDREKDQMKEVKQSSGVRRRYLYRLWGTRPQTSASVNVESHSQTNERALRDPPFQSSSKKNPQVANLPVPTGDLSNCLRKSRSLTFARLRSGAITRVSRFASSCSLSTTMNVPASSSTTMSDDVFRTKILLLGQRRCVCEPRLPVVLVDAQ